MGYITHARGVIRIVPPLTNREMQGSPFMPDVARQRGTDRDVMFQVETQEVETEDGWLFKRTATGIVSSWEDESRNYNIVEHLQELVDRHGAGREFVGRFDMEGEESGDVWRLKVVDGRATRFDPTVVWPEGSE